MSLIMIWWAMRSLPASAALLFLAPASAIAMANATCGVLSGRFGSHDGTDGIRCDPTLSTTAIGGVPYGAILSVRFERRG